MEGLRAILGGLLGSALGLMMLGFGILSFPLNILAVMHLWGWEWWSAAIGVTFFVCIPALGQIGYLVLAVMGGYYLWQADFNWREAATSQTPTTFSFESLSPEKLSEFKAKQIKPNLERSCKSDAKGLAGSLDGKIPIAAANMCECYARVYVEIITKEDLVYQETHRGGYPTDFENRVKTALRVRCV
jgi:hypothetical protein